MDQQVVERASTRTILRLGEIDTPVGLFKISRDPKPRAWAKPPVEAPAGSAEAAPKADPLAGSSSAGKGSIANAEARAAREQFSGDDTPTEKPRKGILKPDGAFVDLTDQLAEIAEQTTLDRLEIVSFIRREQVDRFRVLGAYYVGAGSLKKGQSGYPPLQVLAMLYKALKQSERAAVVRWGKRSRSSIGALVAHRSGALAILELAYTENVMLPNPDCLTHRHVEVPEGRVDQMVALVEAMAASRSSLDDLRDRRAELEDELAVRAEHGELDDFTADTYEADEQLGDLAQVLEESLQMAAV